MIPRSMLELRSKWSSWPRFPKLDGIPPSRLLWLRFSIWSCRRFPKLLGMCPLNSFFDRTSDDKLVRLPIEDGIVPTKRFSWRYRCTRFLSFPIHSIVPVRLFPSSPRANKPRRFCMIGGTFPDRRFAPKYRTWMTVDSLHDEVQFAKAYKNAQLSWSLASILLPQR